MEFEGLARHRRMPSMTPLIDIVFLLLVFFMLTAHFVQDEMLAISLPEAKTASAEENTEALTIVIDDLGQIWINNEGIKPSELKNRLLQLLQQRTNKQIILRGDQTTKLGLMVTVMDAARMAGAQTFDIVTQQP